MLSSPSQPLVATTGTRARSRRVRSGFSLIELLVSVAIIGVLAGLLLPALGRARNLARRTACLSNLRQIGYATAMYLDDYRGQMPWVADEDLQLTPLVNSAGKRYNRMGAFMPLLDPYLATPEIWRSPPVRRVDTNSWLTHFHGAWRTQGKEHPQLGLANYISDKLAETDPTAARYLRGRTPESCALKRGTSVAAEEWLMSPFFERAWWPGHHAAWSLGESAPPSRGWSAHDGGRNQLYLDFHADWIRRDIQ
jgi:prepilin-type N-terminal cleavage/methylation domain-containing protein